MRPVMYMTYGGPPMPNRAPMTPPAMPGRRPAPAEPSHGVTAEHHVEREDAHEQPQRQQRRVPGQVDEQRHAQRETDEGERHERRELQPVRLPARVEPEDQRRAEVKDRGQRQDEREGEEVDEDGNGDRRRPEARNAEHHVGGKDHEPHEDQHRHRTVTSPDASPATHVGQAVRPVTMPCSPAWSGLGTSTPERADGAQCRPRVAPIRRVVRVDQGLLGELDGAD